MVGAASPSQAGTPCSADSDPIPLDTDAGRRWGEHSRGSCASGPTGRWCPEQLATPRPGLGRLYPQVGTHQPCSDPARPAEEGGCPLSGLGLGRSAPMSRQRQRAGAEVRGTRQVLFWVSATSLLGRQAGGTAGRRRAGAAVRPPAAQGLQQVTHTPCARPGGGGRAGLPLGLGTWAGGTDWAAQPRAAARD